ncbi:MAG TPA: flagellar basal body rod C-terminal domain-containing protein, partial [Bryobacteraceae bacterium]|nr:flagellar basal body rod C-terminal domain-containing protein [Bryobacteraceae bacterium]
VQISTIALSGMDRAQSQLEGTARRLARGPSQTDSTDLSANMVALLKVRNDFAANTKTLKAADEMKRRVIDILA